ncbi:MAG: restriction endonuclease subunit S [Oscillospiraceae bacterium]|nr:restriction endonuclease subunit S [Oscillospiraceae bacterium]
MKDGYQVLGKYIEIVDERNKALAVTSLLGVSITKQFIPSIANIVGTDMTSYKIVRTGQFAYGPVTSRNGEKVSIALLKEDDCIISSSYTVFEVVKKDELDPEYLMLWFSRLEFDRYARYMSHGSVREIFGWEEMCKVELPVPSIDRQKAIVKAYKTITDRIELKRKINDNLAQTADAIFQSYFIQHPQNETQKKACFADFILASTGGDWGQDSPSGNYTEKVACIRGTDIPSLNTGSISDAPIRYILPKNLATKRIRNNNMVVEISGGSPVQATGRIAVVPEQVLKYRSQSIICSNFCKVISVKEDYVYFFLQYWLYLYRNGRMFDYENSSTGLKNFDFTSFVTKEPILFPQRDQIDSFNTKLKPIYTELFCAGFEIEVLQETQRHVLSHIMLNRV